MPLFNFRAPQKKMPLFFIVILILYLNLKWQLCHIFQRNWHFPNLREFWHFGCGNGSGTQFAISFFIFEKWLAILPKYPPVWMLLDPTISAPALLNASFNFQVITSETSPSNRLSSGVRLRMMERYEDDEVTGAPQLLHGQSMHFIFSSTWMCDSEKGWNTTRWCSRHIQ